MRYEAPLLMSLARSQKLLEADEERDLITRAQAGDQAARDRVLLAHARLAIHHASRARGYGIPVEDMTQIAMEAMAKAIDRFDINAGARFSTFATFQVKADIVLTALAGPSVVKTGSTRWQKSMFFSGKRHYEARKSAGMLHADIIAEMAQRYSCTPAQAEDQLRRLGTTDRSTDAPILTADGGSITFGEILPDDGPVQDEMLADAERAEARKTALRGAMKVLDAREADIVAARHLREEGETETLEDCAIRFGISRERVRQIEQKALTKLRRAIIAQGAPCFGQSS